LDGRRISGPNGKRDCANGKGHGHDGDEGRLGGFPGRRPLSSRIHEFVDGIVISPLLEEIEA
jgi:hypothetical protein